MAFRGHFTVCLLLTYTWSIFDVWVKICWRASLTVSVSRVAQTTLLSISTKNVRNMMTYVTTTFHSIKWCLWHYLTREPLLVGSRQGKNLLSGVRNWHFTCQLSTLHKKWWWKIPLNTHLKGSKCMAFTKQSTNMLERVAYHTNRNDKKMLIEKWHLTGSFST